MKAERISRKVVLIGLITILLCFVGGSIAFAGIPKVGGDEFCDLCHEEGNGGGGKPLLPIYQGPDGCVNCHSHATSSTTYTLSGGGETVTVPVVNYTGVSLADDAPILAGGNFWWVKEGNADADDTKGHNVFLGEPDGNFPWPDPTPGMSNGIGGCGGGANSCHYDLSQENFFNGTRQGCTKCHMNGDTGSPSGYHHADDSNTVVGSDTPDTDGFFRFLDGHWPTGGLGHGVCGIEDADWQATFDASDHNEYLGSSSGDKDSVASGFGGSNGLGHTVTAFCSGCHGAFHWSSDDAGGGDWIRHPSAAVLPSSGEFASYTTYNPLAPVERPNLTGWTAPSGTVTPGTDLASCLSCHRAHGSPHAKMLRWDPTAADACAICHTTKVTETEGQYHVADVADCNVCHTSHGDGPPDYEPNGRVPLAYDQHSLVAEVITTPNSGDKDVIYPSGEASDFVSDGDPEYDGVCEVCHTTTKYHRNDATGDHAHYADQDCTTCHTHEDEFGGAMPDNSPHNTHTAGTAKGPDAMACDDCHSVGYYAGALDDMITAGICDDCHSPDGAFDGIDDLDVGVRYNWAEGVYEADGATLKSGKEQWCATCHDDEAASSRPGPGVEVVVDNPDATFVCTWGTSSTGGYNGDYRWHAAGTGSCTATWTPNLPAADTYNVRAWWKASTNRATNAKYTIYYDGGSETIEVNQQINGNQWNLLGTFPFAAGTSGYVVLSDDANQYVIADAVKFDNGSLKVSINAPNVTGDDSTYGFYVNGHNIDCLSCHDAGKEHIDHQHRTYDADVTAYGDSYRLKVPSSKPSRYLCFVCHNSTEVLGQNSADVSHTNFWNNDSHIENSHWLHVGLTGVHFDSDWDGTIDSTESCITCHNVHSSPSEAMIRHGELISTYGTTDKVPALNFSYLGSTTLVGSTGGRMAYAGPGVGQNGVCWACHSAISYYRTPFLGPRVIMGQGDPEEVANDGSGTSTISVYVSDPDGDMSTGSVEIDLTPIGGSANQAMTDDGGGYYSYLVTIPASTPDSPLTFQITATDALANTGKGAVTLIVVDPDGIYVDNADAQLVCDWGVSATGGYRGDYRWHAAGTGSCTATWTPDVPSAETYNVYAWWKASSNRATNAKYTIYHETGSQTVEVNQEIGSSQWNYLGNFSFAAGTSGYVVLSDDANEYVVADAIKLTASAPPPPETVIVDNPNAQFVCYWGTSATGGYNNDYRWHAAGTGSCTATWTPNLVAGSSYSVYAWWKASSNRATDAPYTIYYDGGSATVDVNQQINGNQWNLLGTYSFVAGQSGYVVLSDDANQYVIADAVKFEP